MNIMNIAILLVHAYQKHGDAMEWRAVRTVVMKQTVVSLGYHKTRMRQIFDWITNHMILFLFFWTISLDEDYIESELIEYIDYIDHQFTSENMSGTGKDKNTTNKSNKGTNNSISFQYHL